MSLLNLIKPKQRERLKVEIAKVAHTPYECYLCDGHFGKQPSFPTHEDLIEHHLHCHRHGYGTPLEKKSFEHEPPKVITRTEPKKSVDFAIWLRCMFSHHPRYDFVQYHSSSYSSNIPQVILFERTRKVKVAMTVPEALERMKR